MSNRPLSSSTKKTSLQPIKINKAPSTKPILKPKKSKKTISDPVYLQLLKIQQMCDETPQQNEKKPSKPLVKKPSKSSQSIEKLSLKESQPPEEKSLKESQPIEKQQIQSIESHPTNQPIQYQHILQKPLYNPIPIREEPQTYSTPFVKPSPSQQQQQQQYGYNFISSNYPYSINSSSLSSSSQPSYYNQYTTYQNIYQTPFNGYSPINQQPMPYYSPSFVPTYQNISLIPNLVSPYQVVNNQQPQNQYEQGYQLYNKYKPEHNKYKQEIPKTISYGGNTTKKPNTLTSPSKPKIIPIQSSKPYYKRDSIFKEEEPQIELEQKQYPKMKDEYYKKPKEPKEIKTITEKQNNENEKKITHSHHQIKSQLSKKPKDKFFINFYDGVNTLKEVESIQKKPEINLKDENDNLIGTSQELEKHYFRIKGEPKSSEVRPLQVLYKSLNYVLTKYKENKEYDYICDQLKAIRQDLTLQHIENEFSIKVYEIHSDISLENNDVSEFIQCASALKQLYKKFGYSNNNPKVIFYISAMILCNMDSKNVSPITNYSLLREIPIEILINPNIQFVLNVKRAFDNGEYFTYLKLFKEAIPKFKVIMKLAIEKVRLKGLMLLFMSIGGVIEVKDVMNFLSFSNEKEYQEFISKYPLIQDSNGKIQCVETLKSISKS
ncbi:leukocyte receptor cluster (lrc) member, putative [Entamoeba dispar SAW760]|uniref:Leukocyte receptor cluster (Lrc) member, putative n=1 Tax=Entamoeba dispar (strain ATCC PRA-260 / SAW760) TaxID=370354 RepID=B0EPP3_ENTDS|nr:leukocyte receptor cluster (lrc) member, putative [Entamoeba dispar SAW760]EDR23473.1 leukocyte receptor cluster (lrc) member, putative [Entamoeba dispar SAW760]|eukprot:EDR23473.1 leukocyte receptor cluster (lrc) member, putative [Entamoeba dispar SAW760]